MRSAVKLTKLVVDRAEPGPKDTYLWDAALTGFGVKITPTGSRVYLVQYRPKGGGNSTRRYTIGRHEDPWKTEAARKVAADILAKVRLGEDPFLDAKRMRDGERATRMSEADQQKRAERERFQTVVEEFIRKHARPKNRSWREAQRILTSDDLAQWRDRSISSITPLDVVELMDLVSERSHGAARLLFAHLRKLFNWAVERFLIQASPMAGRKGPNQPAHRDRVLAGDELRVIWRAVDALRSEYQPLLWMLVLTAQRRSEVAGMTWSELDLANGEWVIPALRSKNKAAHAVDLSPAAISILRHVRNAQQADAIESQFVFTTNGKSPVSGFSQIKKSLDEEIGRLNVIDGPSNTLPMAKWRIHDLRRTAATGMASLGFSPEVVEAVLNHKSGVRRGLVAIYQHYDYRPERKAALLAWSAHVKALVGQKRLERDDDPNKRRR